LHQRGDQPFDWPPFSFLADDTEDGQRPSTAMPRKKQELAVLESVEPLIREIRGERVVLDHDLARIYGVPTKRLNEQIRRNPDRFPPDFVFRLTEEEAESLRSQMATLKSGRGQHRKYLPYAFTEHGAVMAANVLNTPQAVQMSVFVVRAFLKMRTLLADTKGLTQKLAALEAELKARLDVHESAIVDVLQRIMRLLDPPPTPPRPEPKRREMGFHARGEADKPSQPKAQQTARTRRKNRP
jgi:phage regulator Rha-like protein